MKTLLTIALLVVMFSYARAQTLAQPSSGGGSFAGGGAGTSYQDVTETAAPAWKCK